MKSCSQNFRIAGILILVVLALTSCKRKKSYLISGKLMDKCGGTGIANRNLQVSYKREYSWFSSSQNVDNAGSGTTDADGNFSFNFVKEFNNGEWTLTDKTSGKRYNFNINKSYKTTMPLGIFYKDSVLYKSDVNITISGTISAADTLFVRSLNQTKTIFPVTEKTYKLNFESSLPQNGNGSLPNETVSHPLQWGIGVSALKIKDSVHSLKINYNPCNYIETPQNEITMFQ